MGLSSITLLTLLKVVYSIIIKTMGLYHGTSIYIVS